MYSTNENRKLSKPTTEENRIAKGIVHAAYEVHKGLGPGLLEKVYELCLMDELVRSGFTVERQTFVPIRYKGREFEEGLRLDIMVNQSVLCEIKAQPQLNELWKAQVLSHLTLTELKLGFLINFNVPLIKDGIQRLINIRV